jgi:protein-S-isoprenylcysteine O-methyltransferase Ste14
MSNHPNDRPKVVALPPVILAVTLALGFGLESFWPLGLPPHGVARSIGVLFLFAGLAIGGLAVREMIACDTPLDVRKPTRAIVTSGVFALSRNPIYLGMVLLCLGIALIAGSIWLLLLTFVFAAVLEYGVILAEERYLERKFGVAYLLYKARVRRWI